MNPFSRRKKVKTSKANKTVSYDEALPAGTSIGSIVTNFWNSQKNPGKAYDFNRRVHHGEVGILLGLSNLFKERRPDAAEYYRDWAKHYREMILLTKRNGLSLRKRRAALSRKCYLIIKSRREKVMKRMGKGTERNMKKMIFIVMITTLMLTILLSVNLMKGRAQVNSSQYDMKSVTDSINKSLTKLVGGNSSELLKNTIASISRK
jgi:hypothetical protein